MTQALSLLSAGLMALVPLLLVFGLHWLEAREIAAAFALLALLRWRLTPAGSPAAQLVPAALLALALVVLASDNPAWFRYYPVAINGALLLLFGASLQRGPSLIERIARLREPDLPPEAVRYTRRVTQIWCLFFLLNGAAALYTALACSLQTWALYNGGIAYLLMGLLFAGEFCLRQQLRRQHPS
ncbi:hypothetical protein [Parahaliea mediterranea]|uniref:COG4648 family protein n=1 Tax=Parahaliea mediterranea TaxID=651086 RepID=UPI000E2F1EAF|nr:hypothetical protein [Parahaliea mediterranea]